MNAINMNSNGNSNNANSEDAPLDPAVERVRRKMMRLMGISVAIMMIGVMAVIGAIIYKISGRADKKDQVAVSQNFVPVNTGANSLSQLSGNENIIGKVTLPANSKLLSSNLHGDKLLLKLEISDGSTGLWIYDLVANRVFAKIAIGQE